MNQKLIVRKLLPWFARNARDLPWRRTRDPYAIWVSEIMLQQTQVKTVLPYWERWMRALPNITALAGARQEKLHKLWEGLGYYTRVRNLQQAARLVIERHGGAFPEQYDDVLDLPGVGPYTAGAICSIAFNQPRPILDGNVVRVLSRVFGIDGNPREARTRARLWRIAEELVVAAAPQGKGKQRSSSAFNQSLMELGALVCTPRRPQCEECPLLDHCVAYRDNRVQDLPCPGPRPRATPRWFVAFVARHGNRFLVRQRPAGVVNAHLWEFPNVELAANGSDAPPPTPRVRCARFSVSVAPNSLKAGHRAAPASAELARAAHRSLGLRPDAFQPLCTIRHSITRYRITLSVFRVTVRFAAGTAPAKGRWLTRRELTRLAFASAHKQILRQLPLQCGKRAA
jgi:A/G-specific adenine glycosylase